MHGENMKLTQYFYLPLINCTAKSKFLGRKTTEGTFDSPPGTTMSAGMSVRLIHSHALSSCW